MAELSNMSPEEQRQWWYEQAQAALTAFKMEMASLAWLGYTHNAVFRVDDQANRFVLRLQSVTTWPQMQSEIAVLEQLAEYGLAAPRVRRSMRLDETCALLVSHLDGISISSGEIEPDHLYAVGQYLGRLHSAPISTKNRPRLDWEGLFGAGGIYDPGDAAIQLFTDEQRQIMNLTIQRAGRVMDALDTLPAEKGLIHGDLLLKNVLFTPDGRAQALDWEYCGDGYYLYDLTPILWMLKTHADYSLFEQALWLGYTAERSLDDQHRARVETLIAARQVASMRWLVTNRHLPAYTDRWQQILAQRSAELSHFLDTGYLKRT